MTSAVIRQKCGVAGPDTKSGFYPGADNEPQRATYSAAVVGFTPAATPTDVVVLRGSASKIIRLRQINLAGVATAAGSVIASLIRRSTANTGGTPVAVTPLAADPASDDAVTAVLNYYTANPTGLGAVLGTVHAGRVSVAPAANSQDRLTSQLSWLNDKAVVLNGVNDFLCISLGGQALPAGLALDFDLTWTEE